MFMQSQMKTNRLPPEIKTSLSCSAAFCAPLPITKKGDSWEKKSQEDKTKFQTHNCCRKLVHEWMAITSNSTRVTCVANHGSLPTWSCHYIAYRYDRCVIDSDSWTWRIDKAYSSYCQLHIGDKLVVSIL